MFYEFFFFLKINSVREISTYMVGYKMQLLISM
jgi:hypothetical protein